MTKNYFYIYGKKIAMSDDTAQSILDSQKPKQLTYENIAKELFSIKPCYAINTLGRLSFADYKNFKETPTKAGICSTSQKQLESILALNKLCNVAKYLNDGWLPKFNYTQKNHYIYIGDKSNIGTGAHEIINISIVYFKTSKLAKQATEILGETEIRKALTLNH